VASSELTILLSKFSDDQYVDALSALSQHYPIFKGVSLYLTTMFLKIPFCMVGRSRGIGCGACGPSKPHLDPKTGRNGAKRIAVQFVDEGLFGNIPDHLQNYIDYDAMARDLSMDDVAGTNLIYRCG
jgi:hypothetical protein